MYDELVKRLRCVAEEVADDYDVDPYNAEQRCLAILQAANAIEQLSNAGSAYGRGWTLGYDAGREESKPRWIPVTERLPKCEKEVLICTERKLVGKDACIDSIVTPAIYEDGTMPECDSIWHWEDIDYAGWDEENDCGIIPEGWWENRHFNPDEVYNNPVDRKVVAWMPLPDPYKPKEE